MKKLFLVSIVIGLLLTGCISEREKSDDKTEEYIDRIKTLEEKQSALEVQITALEEALAEADKLIEEAEKKITVIDPGPEPQKRLTMTELDVFSHDIDSDGIVEELTLYTSAARDNQGRMMWDDGQQFLLVLEDGENYYSLFDGYVQLGRVFFTVYLGTEDTNPGILTLVSTYDGLGLVNHEFLPEGGVGMRDSYPTGDMNVIFSSNPWD